MHGASRAWAATVVLGIMEPPALFKAWHPESHGEEGSKLVLRELWATEMPQKTQTKWILPNCLDFVHFQQS